MALLTTLVAIAAGVVLYLAADYLADSTAGRLSLLFGVFVLPSLALLGGATSAYHTSSSTSFCLECHEMTDHGRTLFADRPTALAAVHYQKRLVDRDQACFQCHTNYAMFGNITAKMDGLKHVWVHYFGDVPAPADIELYEAYPNRNCLHCHDDSRSYLEAAPHRNLFESLRTEEQSCLSCHSTAHDLEAVEAGDFWVHE